MDLLYLLKRGVREKNVGLQWVEIFSEVSSVRGKYCTLFENEKGVSLFQDFEVISVFGVQSILGTCDSGLSFSVGISPKPRWGL